MSRIEEKFAQLKNAGRKGLVIFITAGIPSVEGTIETIRAAEKAGADLIELGIPFSDPMADGPVIQEASARSIRNGMKLKKVLDIVRTIRQESDIPLLAMGYLNNILNYGLEKFVADFKAAGLDGIILPDVPHEESAELRALGEANDFPIVEFVTPGTVPERIKETCIGAKGFIYCVSVNGVTGVRQIDYGPIGKVAQMVREYCDVPVAVGFGIGSPETALAAAKHADAVIVGSAVVKYLLNDDIAGATQLIGELRRALDTYQS